MRTARRTSASSSRSRGSRSDLVIPSEVEGRIHSAAASAAASFFLFVAAWIAAFLAAGAFVWHSWAMLFAAAFATFATTRILDPGWRIGFVVRPALAARDFLLGAALAMLLVGACDLLLMAFGVVRHSFRGAFPWQQLLLVFIPAAMHEEVVFRGYLFQKLRAWHRAIGYAFSALFFAALHLGNHAVTPIAVANIALAGILLALAYERYERLWFPIGVHLAWNLFSGPILGYPVSGFVDQTSVLVTATRGPDWITGGAFGIEGSVAIAVVEIVGIVSLQFAVHRHRMEQP